MPGSIVIFVLEQLKNIVEAESNYKFQLDELFPQCLNDARVGTL